MALHAINLCSHYSVPEWAKQNALAKVLNIDLSGLNEDKIYYELDKIHLLDLAVGFDIKELGLNMNMMKTKELAAKVKL